MPDDDEIIRKIQEASERYQPAYDDASWADMQRLLDEHLPQKKNKRRIIFLILLTLIPLIGIYVGYKFKSPGTVPISSNSASVAPNTSPVKMPEVNQLKHPVTEDQKNTAQIQVNSNTNNLPGKTSTGKITGNGNSYIQYPSLTRRIPLLKHEHKNTSVTITGSSSGNEVPEKTSEEMAVGNTETRVPDNTTARILSPDKTVATNKIDSLPNKKQTSVTGGSNKKDTAKNNVIAKALKKDNNLFKHYWIISAALGPDVSAVKLDNAGKITLQYGVALGYAISQRFTLRTGFFISKKLYSVGADDYHAEGSYYNNYLQTVDANCKVYEIPLMATYNFARTKKGGWFLSAGLSSYFMKKESYDYFYKYPGGGTYTDNYTVSNKNKHYFSIIDFSTGYERTINKRLSISAEPYIKLPVTGIGVGRIKLSSAGVLFSVNVKPFK